MIYEKKKEDLERGKENGVCRKCNNPNTSPAWCKKCDPKKITKGWSSGNKDIDNCIKEFQLKTTEYEKVIEWIHFDKLTNLQKIGENRDEISFIATWEDGIRKIGPDNVQSRNEFCSVNLKTLPGSQTSTSNFIEEFKALMQANNSIIYGITKDDATSNGYMIVVPDEYSSKRKKSYGQCVHCKHYNTSLAWCQSCDIWKTTQEWTKWTSGDEDIDNCIKEFQLKATEYEKVIEWIPFNKLTNLQQIREKKSEILFMATWLDGTRKVKNDDKSRIKSCGVNLKKLQSSQMDALKFIKDFKNYMQLNRNAVYGITKDDETSNGFMIVLDEFSSIRNESYGICEGCKQYNTSLVWCQSCDLWKTTQELTKWTSGDENIDDCIKDFQLKTTAYDKIIEWIPFDRLKNLQEIGRGGFSEVYSAEWLDGKRIILNIEDDKYERLRQPLFSVALKTLKSSPVPQINSACSFEFLRNFKNLVQCGSELEIYGITRDTKTEEYFMVHQYANNGNLHEFLSKYFNKLEWQDKLKLLVDITKDLIQIHGNGNIHNNMHSGNILIDLDLQNNLKSYISDPNSFKGKDEHYSKGEIYGVMPYVAPEVLLGEQSTQAADIYSLGIIMAEVSTGKRPCVGRPFDENLAIEIINKNWLPEFAEGTPDLYIELANQCMNSDPQKRPIARDVYNKLNEWFNKITGSDDTNEIKQKFLDANKLIRTYKTIYQKHEKSKYTSKLIDTKKIKDRAFSKKIEVVISVD